MIIQKLYHLLEASTSSPKMDCVLSNVDMTNGPFLWMLSITGSFSKINDVLFLIADTLSFLFVVRVSVRYCYGVFHHFRA